MFTPFLGLGLETAVSVLGVGVPAAWAALEFHRAQKWKRAEFAAELMKELLDHHRVRAAQRLLWGERSVSLTEGKAPEQVRDDDLLSALKPLAAGGAYTPQQLEIRRCFDSLFARLQTVDHHVASGLLAISNVAHYLAYTSELLVGKDPRRHVNSPLQSAVESYASAQSFDSALSFARAVRERALRARSWDAARAGT